MEKLTKLLPLFFISVFILSCSNDDNNDTALVTPVEEEIKISLNLSEAQIEEKDYVELKITNSDKTLSADYSFEYANKEIADVEIIKDKYYINANKLGTTTIIVKYKDAKADCKINVVARKVPIDFKFISIVDNKHALAYLKLNASREEQQAAELYIDKQLLKYNSEYRRDDLMIPEQEEYLNYRTKNALEQKEGIIETLYGNAAQTYLVGYEDLKSAREFIDKSLLPLGFKPLDPSMYEGNTMYAYTYNDGVNKIIVVIAPYQYQQLGNLKTIRYLTGPLWDM